jgi:hypothetical protein
MKSFYELPSHHEVTLTYAGIGNRDIETAIEPVSNKPVFIIMRWISGELEKLGYTLYSGGAKGADSAFESGVIDSNHKQIFRATDATDETRAIARFLHPLHSKLSGYALDLFARNTNQVFGRYLDSVVDFVLCYTRDGCESHDTRSRDTGGTGQAIEMASRKGALVFNMKNSNWLDRLNDYLHSIKVLPQSAYLCIPGDL